LPSVGPGPVLSSQDISCPGAILRIPHPAPEGIDPSSALPAAFGGGGEDPSVQGPPTGGPERGLTTASATRGVASRYFVRAP